MDIIAEDASITRSFNTVQFSSGAPFLLDGTPSMHARVNGGVTQITAGFTLTASFDSITGENQWVLDTSASASFTAGSRVEVFIAAGTVDSVSVVGLKVYEFIIGTTTSLDAAITRLMAALPNAAPAANGGLPTVNGSNYIAGMQGTINTLDALDTAQDSQHSTTQTAVADVPTVTEFEARTLLAAEYGTAANQTTLATELAKAKENTDYPDGWTIVGGPFCTYGASGTVVGVNGTQRSPSLSWSDAYTIALARLCRRLKYTETIWNSAPVASNNLEMNIGQGVSNFIIDLGGAGIEFPNAMKASNRTRIQNGFLYGKDAETLTFEDGTGGMYFKDVVFGSAVNFDGRFSTAENCKIALSWTFLASASPLAMRFLRCQRYNSSASIIFDMGGQDGAVQWEDWSGDVELKNATDAGLNLDWHGNGILKIFDSCTAGTIHVSGMYVVDENDVEWVNGVGKPTVTMVSSEAPTVEEIRTEMDDNSTELAAILNRLPTSLVSGRMDASVGAMAANVMTAAASAADLIAEIQLAITGGAYDLNTDANGSIRIVDGTGTGEIDTASGLVRLSAAGVDDIFDEVVQGAYTFRQLQRLQSAAAGGKTSGALGAEFIIRNILDTVDTVTAQVDGDGNRTAVVYDLSA